MSTAEDARHVSAKLAMFSSVLLRHGKTFAAAAHEVHGKTGIELSGKLADLARQVTNTTEELHDFRRWLTDLARDLGR